MNGFSQLSQLCVWAWLGELAWETDSFGLFCLFCLFCLCSGALCEPILTWIVS